MVFLIAASRVLIAEAIGPVVEAYRPANHLEPQQPTDDAHSRAHRMFLPSEHDS